MTESATVSPKHRPLDDETAAALTLYNTYVAADREQQAHERALRKAEKAKDDAAAAVRKLNDRKAPAEETAEAETRYREAVQALQRLRDGGTAGPQDSDDGGDESAGDAGAENAPTERAEDTDSDTEAENAPTEKAEDTDSNTADEVSSVGVEASVGDEDLAGDEPAGVAG